MLDCNNTFADIHNRQIIIEGGAYYFAVIDQWSYLALRITYVNGTSQVIDVGNSTGQYLFDREALKNNPIVSVTYQEGAPDVGSKILYGYYDTSDIAFSLIASVTRETVVDQIIGHPQTSYRIDSFKINYVPTILNGIGYRDLATDLQKVYGEDEIPRCTLGKFNNLKANPERLLSFIKKKINIMKLQNVIMRFVNGMILIFIKFSKKVMALGNLRINIVDVLQIISYYQSQVISLN